MSFCRECGKELSEGVIFCHNCGTKTAETESSPTVKQLGADVGKATLTMLKSLQQTGSEALKQLGENKKWIIALIALLVANPIFMFLPSMKVEANFFISYSENMSISSALSQSGLGFLSVLRVLLLISAVIFLIVPPLMKRKYTTKYFILSKIYSIYTISVSSLVFLLFLILGAEEAQGLANVGLTFWGYLYLAVNIVLIVVVFKLSSKFKAKRATAPFQAPYNGVVPNQQYYAPQQQYIQQNQGNVSQSGCCRQCGSELDANTAFCPRCGSKTN